jgi:hypothetical protein
MGLFDKPPYCTDLTGEGACGPAAGGQLIVSRRRPAVTSAIFSSLSFVEITDNQSYGTDCEMRSI